MGIDNIAPPWWAEKVIIVISPTQEKEYGFSDRDIVVANNEAVLFAPEDADQESPSTIRVPPTHTYEILDVDRGAGA